MDSSLPDTPLLISNSEVLELLQSRLAAREPQKRRKFRDRDWIEEKVVDFLKTTPCTKLDVSFRDELMTRLTSRKKQKPSGASNGSSWTMGFDLTAAEALQIVNFMPSEPVEIHLMVEDLHKRMSEKEQDSLLELVESFARQGNATVEGGQVNNEQSVAASVPIKMEDEHNINGH